MKVSLVDLFLLAPTIEEQAFNDMLVARKRKNEPALLDRRFLRNAHRLLGLGWGGGARLLGFSQPLGRGAVLDLSHQQGFLAGADGSALARCQVRGLVRAEAQDGARARISHP